MAVKKLYTEGYIADIAEALREVTGDESARYNTVEMSQAISRLASPTDFARNNIASLKRQMDYTLETNPSGLAFYPDRRHFYVLPSNYKVNAGLTFEFINGNFKPTGIQFQQDNVDRTPGMCHPGSSSYASTGIDNFVPLMPMDMSKTDNLGDTICRYNSQYHSEMLGFDAQILNIDTQYTHSLITEAYSNDAKLSFSSFMANTNAGLFDIIEDSFSPPINYGNEVPIYKGYIFVTPDNILVVSVFLDISSWHGEFSFDGTVLKSDNWVHMSHNAINSDFIYDPYPIDLTSSSNTSAINGYLSGFTSPELIQSRFLYATSDIKDQNDNIIFRSNITLDEFSQWIDYTSLTRGLNRNAITLAPGETQPDDSNSTR